MGGNSFGTLFRITTWGESHGPAIGVVVDGCPAGLSLTAGDIQHELDRRKPGRSHLASERAEADQVMVLSGVMEGVTTGAPIAMIIWNRDADPAAYEKLKNIYRPGHADYTYDIKYGLRDWRGGGRASARETAARVAGGAVAGKILAGRGIGTIAWVEQVGMVCIRSFSQHEINRNSLRCPDEEAAAEMVKLIAEVKEAGDSIGSVVGIQIDGVPPGLGRPVFDRLNARLAQGFFSIPGVKGVEFGAGFAVAAMRGSECNDAMAATGGGIAFTTNHAGGTLGGISSGQTLRARIAFKPPSSIARRQMAVSDTRTTVELSVQGRHDPVIGPRAVPVVEAMARLVLADFLLLRRSDRIEPAAD
ncbi:chorismate synthase [bacterium]|nr:chorismate synthase [candidate division CSSED10-310 bacterium]